MIGTGFVTTMARYNAWQNASVYRAAAALDDGERRRDRGAFFQSIHGTLAHLMWADQTWLDRFAGTGKPRAATISQSKDAYDVWDELVADRSRFDRVILDWADTLDPAWLDGELSWYSGAVQKSMRMPCALTVAHLFNHQTHHRGQVHAMLTAAGQSPDPTDLPLLPDAFEML